MKARPRVRIQELAAPSGVGASPGTDDGKVDGRGAIGVAAGVAAIGAGFAADLAFVGFAFAGFIPVFDFALGPALRAAFFADLRIVFLVVFLTAFFAAFLFLFLLAFALRVFAIVPSRLVRR